MHYSMVLTGWLYECMSGIDTLHHTYTTADTTAPPSPIPPPTRHHTSYITSYIQLPRTLTPPKDPVGPFQLDFRNTGYFWAVTNHNHHHHRHDDPWNKTSARCTGRYATVNNTVCTTVCTVLYTSADTWSCCQQEYHTAPRIRCDTDLLARRYYCTVLYGGTDWNRL